MSREEQLRLELENWHLKGRLLQAQKALMQYQAIEVDQNIARIQKELESSAKQEGKA